MRMHPETSRKPFNPAIDDEALTLPFTTDHPIGLHGYKHNGKYSKTKKPASHTRKSAMLFPGRWNMCLAFIGRT